MNQTWDKGLVLRQDFTALSASDLVYNPMPDNTLRVEGTIFNRVHLQILGFMRNIDFLLKARLIRIKTEDK